MTRTGYDSWDLRTGVGTTATMVATARAVATKQLGGVIDDPFAELLVRAVGTDLFTQIIDGVVDFKDIGAGWFPFFFGIRARAFDDYLVEACQGGISQVVILASGLDSRALRLAWPSATTVYEIDQPEVINWKRNVLVNLGQEPSVRHRTVGIDLRQDWPAALLGAGFDASKPTAWVVEGLFVGYLPPAGQDRILNAITALSAPNSRIAADHFIQRDDVVGNVLDRLHDLWRQHDPNISLRRLTFPGVRQDPAVHLAMRGWNTRNARLADLLGSYRLSVHNVPLLPDSAEYLRFLTGVLVPN
ncbi:hypothetical protein A5645_22925 [Mycobacterium asiaticum]|uniref:SAM-dependent methyltransferase n=1 Tax=Mycobacterium asiaticum TaxID=1790 RepID=UPI0007EFDCAD|nr:class I SAM-dependent methyltransferase [Mycobacterium asiaticum]OBK92643.1 hypothetical protein A5645_22925 [Mycobacterium asiaticum]